MPEDGSDERDGGDEVLAVVMVMIRWWVLSMMLGMLGP